MFCLGSQFILIVIHDIIMYVIFVDSGWFFATTAIWHDEIRIKKGGKQCDTICIKC